MRLLQSNNKVRRPLLRKKVGHGYAEGSSLHASLYGSIHETVPILFGVFAGRILAGPDIEMLHQPQHEGGFDQ